MTTPRHSTAPRDADGGIREDSCEGEIRRLSLEALRLGDIDEWERLYRVSDQLLLSYITRLSCSDRHVCASDIDDILADTYVKARSSRKRIDPKRATILPWLKTIAKRQHLDHRRSSVRREQNTGGTANPILPDDMPLGDKGYLSPETVLAVKEMIEQLSPKEHVLLQELINQSDGALKARGETQNSLAVRCTRLKAKFATTLGLVRRDSR